MNGTGTAHDHLENYLMTNGVPFQLRYHARTYTAPHLAAVEHVPGHRVAKVVMVVAAGNLTMLVIPSTDRLEAERVAEALGTDEVRLATEDEFTPIFPDCEPGAMPPFGNLYGIPVYLDASLAQEETIIFPAGRHDETMTVRLDDYARLVEPRLTVLGYHD